MGIATYYQQTEIVKLLVADPRVKYVELYLILISSIGSSMVIDGGVNMTNITDENKLASFKAILTLNPPVNPPNNEPVS